jgi:membrane protein implicated in regulation of membrane protease activity
VSFGLYILGYILVIAGLAIGANLLNVPPQWIGVGVLCLAGIAIVHGVKATRQRDPST